MRFEKSTVFPVSTEALFAFHERADAFALLQPPWDKTRILQPPTSLAVGTTVILETRIGPIWVRIEAVHTEYEAGVRFVDEMRRGPFARWRHEHRIDADGDGARLTDTIDYEPPFGLLGRIANPIAVAPRLKKLFEFRHDVTARVLAEG